VELRGSDSLTELGVENLLDDELEEFLLHAALIDALFAHKLDLERLLQIPQSG
jgi:hypothetical protein